MPTPTSGTQTLGTSEDLSCTQPTSGPDLREDVLVDPLTEDSWGFFQLNRRGANGRNAMVDMQSRKAYRAGANATPTDWSGSLYRAVDRDYTQSYADHSYSKPGRYNAPGHSMSYNSTSLDALRAEAGHYTGLDGMNVVTSDYSGQVVDASQVSGITSSALSEGFGKDGKHRSLLSQLTGEDPYTHTRAFADGVHTTNASGLLVTPANGKGQHLNLFPENTATHNYTYRGHAPGESADLSPTLFDPNVKSMPDGATPNRWSGDLETIASDNRAHKTANSSRYLMAGTGMTSLYSRWQDDGQLSGADMLWAGTDMAVAHGTGYVESMAARSIDNLRPAQGLNQLMDDIGKTPSPRITTGGMVAGGTTAALFSGGLSMWENADAYERGEVTSSEATADVIVDTGVGVASGLGGMAAGAAVGSVVPVVGTAVGALIGFGAGMLGGYLTSAAIEETGVGDWGREHLTGALDNHTPFLDKAWDGWSDTQDNIVDGATELKDDAFEMVGDAWDGLSDLAGNARDGAANLWDGLFGDGD